MRAAAADEGAEQIDGNRIKAVDDPTHARTIFLALRPATAKNMHPS